MIFSTDNGLCITEHELRITEHEQQETKVHSLRVIGSFARASAQQEMAYRANFGISVLHSLIGLATGLLALDILFGQVPVINGWDQPAMLALLGTFLTLNAVRALVIGPSLDSLAGLDGAIWRGTFDFVLLRPIATQLIASFQVWRPLALFDLCLGVGVLGYAANQMAVGVTAVTHSLAFLITLGAAVTILYSLLLALSSLLFWSPGFLFTWLFDALFQMARYPVGLYPSWLRFILTWVAPVGLMTTVPAQALRGMAGGTAVFGSVCLALVLLVGASWLFRAGVQRYESASS